jgi:Lysozyme like domain
MATGTGDLSYAQLKAVWLQAAAGTQYATNTWATLMAAIAEAESGGNPSITNPSDNNGTQTSWGLWQISNGTHNAPAPNWADPAENASLAIGKLDTQGLTAWGTYDTGAYKAFLSSKTAPDTANIPPGPSAVTTAAITAASQSDAACAWSVGWGGIPGTSWLNDIFGSGGNVGGGELCLLSKPQARALAGAALLGIGGLITLVGLSQVAAAAGVVTAAARAGGGVVKSAGMLAAV